MKTFQREIRQVGFEKYNLPDIRRAFQRGCGAVIAESAVPESVRQEYEGLNDGDRGMMNLQYKGMKRSLWDRIAGHPARRTWEWFGRESLPETRRWLMEEMNQAIAIGLYKPYEDNDELPNMIGWIGAGIHRRWHVDIPPVGRNFDIHIHAAGPGMVVATCKESLTRAFDDRRSSKGQLVPRHLSLAADLDTDLLEQGFEIIALEPGQRLVFQEKCLHRSSQSETMKLRAGIF